jgi:hypothetical protein
MTEKKFSPFDFVNDLTEHKQNLFNEETEAQYSPWLIDQALSFNPDCLFWVNEINKYPDIPKKAQHDFYLNILVKRRRYGRWVKRDSFSDDLQLVKDIFGYSTQHALAALEILTEDQLAQLRTKKDKGGNERLHASGRNL